MDRRDFLKKASAGGIGLALSQPMAKMANAIPAKPNILFIMVDQLRFPSVFPKGVKTVDQFLAKFMPHTYKLWKAGVKFGSHYGATTACSPSRASLITGLYSHQEWLLQTIKSGPNTKVSVTPSLDAGFPTYGKLLRQAGYQTPYLGKWHVSLEQLAKPLEPYGFDGLNGFPDPSGSNLQGAVGDHADGYYNDADIADKAVDWLGQRQIGDQPWCLTVGFVNPHDHEFFWGGTEFKTYNNLFNAQSVFETPYYKPFSFFSQNHDTNYPPVVSWSDDNLKNPRSFGYPVVPPNWETTAQLEANKPAAHSFVRAFSQFVWGGVSEDPGQDQFTIEPYPNNAAPGYGIGLAPYSYWQRNLDSYTQTMMLVDKQIGRVVDALPADVASNTVIVFTSDHGDYGGAHGLVTNKAVTAYEECFHVPLVVMDPAGRFTGDIGTVRAGLTSHVDMLNLLVSLGHGGSQTWLRGLIGEIYGSRHDMIPMLKSAAAPGRDYILFATDEAVAPQYNYNDAAVQIVAMRTKSEKIAIYSKWLPHTTNIKPGTTEVEFYDYSTAGGRAETDNTPHDPRVPALLKTLAKFKKTELEMALPGPYKVAQDRAKAKYLAFLRITNTGQILPEKLKELLGYGGDF